MTERTIEETIEVTEESTVRICEDCGVEVKDGVTLTADTDELPDLHVHRDCIPNMMLDGSEYVRTVDQISRHNDSYPILLALDRQDLFVGIIGVVFGVAGIPMLIASLAIRMPPLLLISLGLTIVSVFALNAAYKHGRRQAKQPIDEVLR